MKTMLIRFLILALLLTTLGTLHACGRPDTLSKPTWEDLGCDTLQRADSLNIYDLVIPFRLADSLRTRLTKAPKIYVLVSDENGVQYWSVLTGTMGGSPQLVDIPVDNPKLSGKYRSLSWLDQTYLWSLADAPTYLYHRWEPLLADSRKKFMSRRDSLLNIYEKQYPKYDLKLSSDLRTASSQSAFLKKGASSVPLSHHQFGLASDVAIVYRKQYQRNYQPYKQLGELTAQAGLHWGGNFVGFIDPPHVQLFYNSGEMVKTYPPLRFEFEPYRGYYLKRVRQRIAEGKEALILDTQQLLTELNQLRKHQPCPCEKATIAPADTSIQQLLLSTNYQADTDILLHGNLATQTITLTHPSAVSLQVKLGKWR